MLEAGQGNYNMDSEQVSIVGPVQFSSANGYRMVTRDVDIDLPERQHGQPG